MDEVTSESQPSGPLTVYSKIRDASLSDFTLTDRGDLGVDIVIQTPPNAYAGQTGVKVERATNEPFTTDLVTVQDFEAQYTLTDTVPAAGEYWYRITYRNGSGAEAGTSPGDFVDVTGTVTEPHAAFSASTPTAGPAPLTVSFVDESTGTITTWSWDFGDGIGTSSQKNPTYVYTSPGTFDVSLTVTGPTTSDTETKPGYVIVTPPEEIAAEFSANPQGGEVPLVVSFTDESTSSGAITSWEWDFDYDGSFVADSTTQNPSHTYSSTGVYSVALRVTGTVGEDTEIKTDLITVVEPGEPIAEFEVDQTTGLVGITVFNFTDQSMGVIDTWDWDFGDSVGTSTDQHPSYTYTSAGTYTVSLTVTGPGGSGTETKTNLITVTTPSEPTAIFSADPTSGERPLTVVFTDESMGLIDTWEWDFGDGGTSTDQDPSYEYTTAGTYTVSLTVTGPGGSNTQTRPGYIVVTEPGPPDAQFSGSPTSGSAILTVTFVDESTGQIDTWEWDFGDGGMSTDPNPVYDYSTPGTYTVSLTVTGPGGSDIETKDNYITVHDPSIINADFEGSPTTGDPPLTVTFTNLSNGNYDTVMWDLDGDGTIDSTVDNPTHTYNITGTYTVTLMIDGPDGDDSETKIGYIVVNDPGWINAEFTADPTSGVAPLQVQFTDLSNGSTIDLWTWDFGDGGTSSEQNPVYTYATPGLYTVRLSVSGPTADDSEIKTGYISVTDAPAVPGADKSKGGGCSCTVDRRPASLDHLLGYFLPLLLLCCAYAAMRRRGAQS
jgi:PKD repeat protein